MFDALEALPAPFRDRLGTVAIVIEDEATPEQLASVGAYGLYGLYQGVRAPLGRGRRPGGEQDHHLPRPAGAREPDARTPGRRGRRHRLPRDRASLRDLRRPAPRAQARRALLRPRPRRRRASESRGVEATQLASHRTTGRRLTPALEGAARRDGVGRRRSRRADQSPMRPATTGRFAPPTGRTRLHSGGARPRPPGGDRWPPARQVERVDPGDPALGRGARHRGVGWPRWRRVGGRVAVVRTRRRDRVVRNGDRHHPDRRNLASSVSRIVATLAA